MNPEGLTAMPMPFIVLDQNALRCSKTISEASDRCRRENLQLLIPDVAGFEFSNVGDPHQTWKRSLREVGRVSELVVVSRKITHVWKEEIKEGVPCISLADDGATSIFRSMLRQDSSGDESAIRNFVNGPVKQMMPPAIQHWSDHEQFKTMIGSFRDFLESSLPEATLKNLRKDRANAMIAWLCSPDGVRFVVQGIMSQGAAREDTFQLAARPSAIGGFISGMTALALYWLAFGGFETIKAADITNDLHDLEYAILGSLCESLVTADKRMKVIHQAIKESTVGRARWFVRAMRMGPENV